MKSTLFILSFCLLFWGCSCKKENNEPEQKKPEPTTDGRNTFYCEINGVPYYQKFVGGQPDFPRITGAYSLLDSGNALDFQAKYILNGKSFIIKFFGNKLKEKIIILLNKENSNIMYYNMQDDGCNYLQSIDFNMFSGKIFFSRFDPRNNIYSGEFEFKNWLPQSGKEKCDTIKVSNGLFDIKL